MSLPKLPPLKLCFPEGRTYVQTYKGVWEKELRDEQGNVVRKGRSRTIDRKTVGKMKPGTRTGYVQFYESFYQDYPELRDYAVYRNEDSSFTLKRISNLHVQNSEDAELIDGVIGTGDYELSDSGKVIKSASGIPMSRDPAELVNASSVYTNHAESFVANDLSARELISTKKGGCFLFVDDSFHKTGLSNALIRTFKEACRNMSARKAYIYARHIEAYLAQMNITGDNTYESFNRFCKEHETMIEMSPHKTTLKRIAALITPKFMDTFHKHFIAEYIKINHTNIIEDGIVLLVDGSPIAHKNKDRIFVTTGRAKNGEFQNQMNVQFMCDATNGCAPIGIDVFNGNTTDIAAFKNVLQKVANYNLTSTNYTVVADKGYTSLDNMVAIERNGGHFILNCRKGDNTDVCKAIKRAIKKGLHTNGTYFSGDNADECYEYIDDPYKYDSTPVQGKRARKDAIMRVRYHVFYNCRIYEDAARKLREELRAAIEAYSKASELTSEQQTILSEYTDFDAEKYKPGQEGKELFVFVNKVNDDLRYEGYQVLVTNNLKLSSLDVRKLYDSRVSIETKIQNMKQHLGGRTTKSKSDAGLMQKLFFQYLALIISSDIGNRVAQARKERSGKYSDVFRSKKEVFSVLSEMVVDKYKSGLVWKPISQKHKYVLDCLGINMPSSLLSCTKLGEKYEEAPAISDDLAGDEEQIAYL